MTYIVNFFLFGVHIGSHEMINIFLRQEEVSSVLWVFPILSCWLFSYQLEVSIKAVYFGWYLNSMK